MAIDDEFDWGPPEPPRKWLDKKKYMRVDPTTGKPQLIRVEPVITASGEFLPDTVNLYVDDILMLMERDAAEAYIQTMGCTPLEETSQWWKHREPN